MRRVLQIRGVGIRGTEPYFLFRYLLLLMLYYFSGPSLAQAHGVLSQPHHEWKHARDREWDVGRNTHGTVPSGFPPSVENSHWSGFPPEVGSSLVRDEIGPTLIGTGMKGNFK